MALTALFSTLGPVEDCPSDVDVTLRADSISIRRSYAWSSGSSARGCAPHWLRHRTRRPVLRWPCFGHVRCPSSLRVFILTCVSSNKRGYVISVLLHRQGNRRSASCGGVRACTVPNVYYPHPQTYDYHFSLNTTRVLSSSNHSDSSRPRGCIARSHHHHLHRTHRNRSPNA